MNQLKTLNFSLSPGSPWKVWPEIVDFGNIDGNIDPLISWGLRNETKGSKKEDWVRLNVVKNCEGSKILASL